MTFTVAIVGRPELRQGYRYSTVSLGAALRWFDHQPGVTRATSQARDLAFKIIDTAGLDDAERKMLSGRGWQEQTAAAMAQAYLLLCRRCARCRDGHRSPPSPISCAAPGGRTILVANKSEGRAGRAAGALES